MGLVKKFWELFESSVIIQSCVTLVFTVTIAALVIMNRSIPTELWAAFTLVLGFWFGTKQNYMTNKTIEQLYEYKNSQKVK